MELILSIIYLLLFVIFIFFTKTIYQKFHIVYFALAIGFVACICKIAETQYINDDVWKDVGTIIKSAKETPITPKRGTIYCLDREGNKVILSSDFPTYEIFFDGAQLADILQDIQKGKIKMSSPNDSVKKLAVLLSDYFHDKTAQNYENLIFNLLKNKKRAKLLQREINYIELLDISQFVLLKGQYQYHTCLDKNTISNRVTPYNDLAARTIGTINKDTAGGKFGIEYKFDKLLKGEKGSATRVKVSRRKSATDILAEAQNGADITLTLDMDIQEIVTNCLLEGVKKTGAERACAIVMETATGEIKAIANLGLVGNNYSEYNINNMAISDCNELGSVFKVPSIMVALQSGVVTDSTLIDVENPPYPNVSDHKQLHGKQPVANVIAMSSNVGTANIICPFFEKKQAEFLNLIKKTHFDAPIVDKFLNYTQPELFNAYNREHKRDTSLRTFATFTFGYQAKIPPIYMLRFYNAIANNGKMIDPFIVKKIENKNGVIFSSDDNKKERVITEAICSHSVLQSVQNMLLRVVESSCGTAYYKNVPTAKPKIKLAGKTGTADLPMPVASKGTFCGYFPADKPQYSCIVVMQRNGKSNLWGTESYIVFKNIAEKIFSVTNSIELSQLNDSINYSPKNLNLDDKKIKYLAKYCKIK